MNILKFFSKIFSGKAISLVVMIMYASYYYFVRSSVGIIRDFLTLEFSLTATDFGKISSAFALSYSLFQIFGGYLLDRFPLRYVIPLSLIGVFCSQHMFICSKDINSLEYSRYLLGFFFAIGVTGRLKYLSLLWSENFVLINGTMFVLMSCTAAFTSSGSFLTHFLKYGWRLVFVSSSIVALILAILLFFFLKPADRAKTKISPLLEDNKLNNLCFFEGCKSIFKTKEFIIIALYTMMISTGSYVLINGHGNSLLGTKFVYLNQINNPYYFSLPATLNILGNGVGAIYNIFVAQIDYRKQMLIHGGLNFFALLGLAYLNFSSTGMLICFFVIGFSYMGQSIGFLWIKNNGEKKYQALSFGMLNFIGVFFGGAMMQRLAGLFLDRIKGSGSPYTYSNYLLLFKLLIIPSFIALLMTFFLNFFLKNKKNP